MMIIILLAIVQSITEFLPISSTGHLILLNQLLAIENPEFLTIFIQFGSAIAILVYYHKRFFDLLTLDRESCRFILALAIAFMPAAIIGALFHNFITKTLFSPFVVAIGMIIGGIAILLVERYKPATTVIEIENISLTKALFIGLIQMVAIIPGISRSGSTIIGGLLCGLSRTTATSFSFFLAAPMLIAASIFELLKTYDQISHETIIIGLSSALLTFFASLIVIRFLIKYVARHSFAPFAYYRIIFGSLLLLYFIG